MKHFFALFLAVFAISAVQAQTFSPLNKTASIDNGNLRKEKARLHYPIHNGNILTGANVSMLFEPEEIRRNPSGGVYHLGVSARVGYFFSDNLVLGLDQIVSNEHNRQYITGTLHTKFGAFGRYYIGKTFHKNGTIHKFRFFMETAVAYGLLRYGDDYQMTYNILDLRIMPGINYFIGPGVAVEAGLNATFELLDNRPGASFIYSPNVGLQFFIARRQRS